MSTAVVEYVHVEPATSLSKGSRFLDFSVDLSSAFAQDCPPISYYRVVVLEPVWLRTLMVTPGMRCDLGALIAIFSTLPDEPEDMAVVRPIRVSTAAILHHSGMWSGSERS